MSKLDQIVDFLETEKTDVAVVSDPVTINYLTGFYSDPHERQLFLFVYTDHEPRSSSFLHLKWNGRLQLSISKWLAMWILKTLGKRLKGLSQNQMLKPLHLNMIT